MNDKNKDAFEQELDPFIQAVLGKKALDVVVLDVRKLTSVADAFIVCSGRSNRQVTALGEFIKQDLKKQGKQPLNVEGLKEGHWVLMDYGYVIVHIFFAQVRSFYDLEGLWADARRIRIEQAVPPNDKTPDAEVYIE